jgi:hypothetical protein
MKHQSVDDFENKIIERREVESCAVEVPSPLILHSLDQSFCLNVNVWQRTPGPNAEDLFIGIKRGI